MKIEFKIFTVDSGDSETIHPLEICLSCCSFHSFFLTRDKLISLHRLIIFISNNLICRMNKNVLSWGRVFVCFTFTKNFGAQSCSSSSFIDFVVHARATSWQSSTAERVNILNFISQMVNVAVVVCWPFPHSHIPSSCFPAHKNMKKARIQLLLIEAECERIDNKKKKQKMLPM